MSYLLAFLLILVPLVLIHEFGHFIMAKAGGINVTKFAFGFGKKLFGFTYKGTEYRWNLLPLGGYVDFMGEVVYTNRIPDDVHHFYNRPKFIRFLVLLMGPLFNLLLALGIFWLFYAVNPYDKIVYHGEPYLVGHVLADSPEAEAGLQKGDRILAINGKAVTSVGMLEETIALNPKDEIRLTITRNGQQRELRYQAPIRQIDGLGDTSFFPAVRIVVADVVAGNPAAAAGFQADDIITHVNGESVYYVNRNIIPMIDILQRTAPEPVTYSLLRDNKQVDVTVSPYQAATGQWVAGFRYSPETTYVEHTPLQALNRGWQDFLQFSTLIYRGIKQLVVGQLSVKALSGPVDVGRVAKESLDYGFWSFLMLMGILSLNLGIMNLLPIPVLDGGEIFVLLVEWIARRDFSITTKMRIKLVGFFFLIGLMGLVIISDIIKVYQASGT